MGHLLQEAYDLQQRITEDRSWLHKNAEVGFSLKNTCEYVEKRLIEMGYEPKECGKSGITAEITGKQGGKCFRLIL